jgi:hypothetical protein
MSCLAHSGARAYTLTILSLCYVYIYYIFDICMCFRLGGVCCLLFVVVGSSSLSLST